MDLKDEFAVKMGQIKEYIGQAGVEGVALTRQDHFAWATCGGRNYVNVAQDAGASTFLFLKDKAYLLTNNIERGRMVDEELKGLPIEVVYMPWVGDRDEFIMEEISGGKVLTDLPIGNLNILPPDFDRLMFEMQATEIIRYRSTGARTGHAIQDACKEVKEGMSEYAIAGLLAESCFEKGVEPIVTLVACDDRAEFYRHPLPTEKKLKKYAMVVVCARRSGLIASATRMVCLGEPSDTLRQRHGASVFVDVVMNVQTVVGADMASIFIAGKEAYWEAGFHRENENHHQGGPTGYKTRYFLVNEKTKETVKANTAFAWNPSITGAKSEDTLLVLGDHNEFITQAPDWPTIELESPEMTIERPDILVL